MKGNASRRGTGRVCARVSGAKIRSNTEFLMNLISSEVCCSATEAVLGDSVENGVKEKPGAEDVSYYQRCLASPSSHYSLQLL